MKQHTINTNSKYVLVISKVYGTSKMLSFIIFITMFDSIDLLISGIADAKKTQINQCPTYTNDFTVVVMWPLIIKAIFVLLQSY